jgi:hypothetical protein
MPSLLSSSSLVRYPFSGADPQPKKRREQKQRQENGKGEEEMTDVAKLLLTVPLTNVLCTDGGAESCDGPKKTLKVVYPCRVDLASAPPHVTMVH